MSGTTKGQKMKMMYSCFRRADVRFRHLVCWSLAAIMIMFAANVSAQDFEEISSSPDDYQTLTSPPKTLQTEHVVPQRLPAVVSTSDSTAQGPSMGIVFAGGNSPSGSVVSAQYQDGNGQQSTRATLPSIQLVQGNVPRLASAEKKPPMPSTYPDAGRIAIQETDGTTPTVTRRPSTRPAQASPQSLPPVTRSQRPMGDAGVVNAYTPSEEIIWEENASQHNAELYETLPNHLGHMSGYTSEGMMSGYGTMPGQYDMLSDPYTADLYGDGMYGINDYNPYGQGMYGQNMYGQGVYGQGVYGQGMYGQGMYGYGGYPGGCPPMYSHGLLTSLYSHIVCSNAWENLTIGVGGSGFKSPISHANGGAFGFSQTLNWASPSTLMSPINLQAGVRAVQAFPSGYDDPYRGTWQSGRRDQFFGTIGVFRRNIGCSPLNIGLAYDMMRDKYFVDYDLEQLRSELSYSGMYGYEFGYRGSHGLKNDSVQLFGQQFDVRTVDYHTLFIKKYFANGGEGSLAGGATEYGDIMVRAEYSIPLSNEWGLKNSFSYVIPQSGHNASSPQRESWDVSLQLVYQPRGGMLAGFCNPFRALFDVADNGTMIQRGR